MRFLKKILFREENICFSANMCRTPSNLRDSVEVFEKNEGFRNKTPGDDFFGDTRLDMQTYFCTTVNQRAYSEHHDLREMQVDEDYGKFKVFHLGTCQCREFVVGSSFPLKIEKDGSSLVIVHQEQINHDIIVSDAETSPSLESPVDWCGAHGVRYTEDFRNVVYKINPNHLSCGYKKLFEASATSSLRGMEPDGEDENDKVFTKKMKDENNTWATTVRPHTQGSCASLHKYKFDSPPPHRGQAQIIRSLSSAYTSVPEKMITKKDFRGWDVCARPHSADNSGYLKFTSAETRDMMRNRSQSACVKVGVRREKVSMSKVQITGPPRAQSTVVRTTNDVSESRETGHSKWYIDHPARSQSTSGRFQGDVTDRTEESPSQTSSTGGSNHNIPVPCPYIASNANSADAISYEFEHFVIPKDHTKKYREDYTYRKLETIRNCTHGSSVLRMNVPSSCIPITVPVFMCPSTDKNKCKTPVDTTPTGSPSHGMMTLAPEESSEDIRIAVNCKKAVIKKRLTKPPITEMGRKVPHFLLAQNGTLRMEFYNNPMTFDVPENDKTTNKPSPIVCRTRPTIPSNAHGNIYPSSTDTHSYVIKRRKGIQ